MKKIIYILVAALLTLAACNKDNAREGFSKKDTVTATLPVQSKTTLNALQVVWSADDAISVFAQNGSSITNNEGTISGGVGTTQATFDVIVEGTTKIAAVYPYSPATAYDGTKVSINMADTYAYVEDGIGGAPMASLIKSNAQSAPINFKNAGALMGITVNNIPAGYNQATLTSMGEEVIAGPCEITFDVDGNPSLVATSSAAAKVITITFDAAAESTNKTFYFPIPVGDYSSLQLAIGNGTDVKVLKTKALVAERSIRYKSTLTLDAVTGVIPTEVEGTGAASDALAAGETSISITVGEDEAEPTIEMAASDATPTLSFEPIPAGKTITIQEGTTGAPEEFVVSASSEGNSSNNFAIITPNSTVSLEANAEEVTYNEVLAHTAAQTLIVGEGVTINDLKVKGGNVRVYGEVKSISRTDDNADAVTYVIVEEGAVISENLGENIIAITVSENDLIKAATEGGEVVLKGDVELSTPLTIAAGKEIVIDLNGNTLSYTTSVAGENMITNNGSLLIKDSQTGGNLAFTYAGEADRTNSKGNYAIVNAGTLTVNGGTLSIKASGAAERVKFPHAMYVIQNAGDVTINGGKIYNANNIAVRMWVGSETKATKIDIKGGELEGIRAIWVQLPSSSKDLAPKANISISGGTLTSWADEDDDSGNRLAIYSYGYGNDMKNVEINVSGGTFNGDIALTGGANKTSIETVNITGGTFNGLWGDVYSYGDNDKAAKTITITGGKFSSVDPIIYMDNEDEKVTLGSDVEITTEKTYLQFNGKGTLDLNGKTISGLTTGSGVNQVLFDVRGDLTVKNGTISTKHTGTNMGWSYCTEVFYLGFNGSLKIEDATIENLGGSDMAYAVDLVNAAAPNGVTLDINNSKILSTYTSVRVFNNGAGMNNVTIKNSEIKSQGSKCFWVHVYTSADNGGKGVKDATLNLDIFGNGNTYESGNPNRLIEFGFSDDWLNFDGDGNQIVSTSSALVEALNAGKSVVVGANIVMEGNVIIPEGKEVILNLNGKTISHSYECTTSYSMITNKGTLVIDGEGKISMTDTSAGGGSVWGSYTITNNGTLTVNNGTIEHLGSTGDWGDNRPTNIPIQNYQGKVTVNGGVISSPQFRSLRDFTAGGEIVINGGIFKGQVWMQGLGNGSSSLTITGGDFTPTQGYDGSSVFVTNGTNDILVSVTGGKFNTKIGCNAATKAGIKGAVKGGVFTEAAKTATYTVVKQN